jgi:hypothetical protein
MRVISALGRRKQENLEFDVSLGYVSEKIRKQNKIKSQKL